MSANPAKSEPQRQTGETGATSSSTHDSRVADLFTKYHDKLVKSLVARTRSWEEARDIASQAFLEVLSQRPGAVSFLGPYLYRTARNLAINRLTHEAMRRGKEPILGYEPRTYPSPEPLWAEQEQVTALQRSIEKLRPRLRMAFVLRVWDELTYDEIVSHFAAGGVDLNVRTVQRYVAEAFKRCREAMLEAEDPPNKGAK